MNAPVNPWSTKGQVLLSSGVTSKRKTYAHSHFLLTSVGINNENQLSAYCQWDYWLRIIEIFMVCAFLPIR